MFCRNNELITHSHLSTKFDPRPSCHMHTIDIFIRRVVVSNHYRKLLRYFPLSLLFHCYIIGKSTKSALQIRVCLSICPSVCSAIFKQIAQLHYYSKILVLIYYDTCIIDHYITANASCGKYCTETTQRVSVLNITISFQWSALVICL